MTLPIAHSPRLRYLCDDPDCCDNGCPQVLCRTSGGLWPCADWRSRHNSTQIIAEYRYVARKSFPGDEVQVAYDIRMRLRNDATP